jgi:hypothetical protein
MTMTAADFEAWMESGDGDDALYEYLYDAHPDLGKHGLFAACESGDYVEEFLDYLITKGLVAS